LENRAAQNAGAPTEAQVQALEEATEERDIQEGHKKFAS